VVTPDPDSRPKSPLTLSLNQYQGNLRDLVARIRRHSLSAMDIPVSQLVRQLRVHWEAVQQVDVIADDLPVTAWVLGRKAQELVADPVDPEPPAPDDRAWVLEAVEVLKRHLAAVEPAVIGPPRWPTPTWPAIADAHPWRLPLAWPPGRPRRPPPPATVVPPTVPLWRRALVLVRRLRRLGRAAAFQQVVADLPVGEQVEQFLVVMALWSRGRLDAEQSEAFGPLHLTMRPRRRSGRP
jgi:chromatin segregation and condensation protein Rec8/ScpA/Scc1 (kleisin family)